jgi:DNA-binding CsgD family transcriptional regulator
MENTVVDERRKQSRRETDRTLDVLYKTFSTKHCRECLQKWNDGVLLLDQNRRVVYITQTAEVIIGANGNTFTLSPIFDLLPSEYQLIFADFTGVNSNSVQSLSIVLENNGVDEKIIMTAAYLPLPAIPNLNTARYLIKLRYFSRTHQLKWQLFAKDFCLTSAELRLCRNLGQGLSLSDYSKRWGITVGSARSQLHAILKKTGTRRQSDLMRLIFSQT